MQKVERTSLDVLAFFALWCFVFSVPFESIIKVPGIGTLSRLMGAIVTPLAMLSVVARNSWRTLWAPHLWMCACLAWTVLTYFWSVWPPDSSERIFQTEAQLVITAIIIWQLVPDDDHALQLCKAYVCGTLVATGSTIIQFASHRVASWGRYSASGIDPNDLSLTLALSIPISYCCFLLNRRWFASVWLVHIVITVIACLLTASRMGAIVCLLALSIVPLTSRMLTLKRKAGLALLAASAVAVCVAIVPSTSWQRLGTISEEVRTGTLNSRTEIWQAGLKVASAHPIAGVGAGAFAAAVEPLISYYDDSHAYVAHNTLLSVLTEQGIIGFLLFVSLIGSLLRSILAIEAPLLRTTWILTLAVWFVGVFTLSWEHHKQTWIIFSLILQTRSALTR